MTCSRVIIIHKGKIVAEDRMENLSAITKGSRRLRLEVKGPATRLSDVYRELTESEKFQRRQLSDCGKSD